MTNPLKNVITPQRKYEMTPEIFCYWLQGLFELTDIQTLDARQVALIREHLNLVFGKVTHDFTAGTLTPEGIVSDKTDKKTRDLLKDYGSNLTSEPKRYC